MAKQDEWVRVTLRLPPELHSQLSEAAQATSMNAEIIYRLERSFVDYLTLSGEGLEQILKQASSVTDTLWEMFFFQREVELDGYITDQANRGNVMSRSQAIAHIVREHLASQGYVFEPPQVRPGLRPAEEVGATDGLNAPRGTTRPKRSGKLVLRSEPTELGEDAITFDEVLALGGNHLVDMLHALQEGDAQKALDAARQVPSMKKLLDQDSSK